MASPHPPPSPPTPLELNPVANDDDDNNHSHRAPSPDAPLLPPTPPTTQPFPRPRWLQTNPSSHWPSWVNKALAALTPFATYILTKLHPRLTWRYALFSLTALYCTYCVITNQHLLASKLPDYDGPHRVGAIDVEVPLPSAERISNTTLKSTGEPAFELSTVLFTIYYPIDKGVKSTQPKLFWFPKPLSLTAAGYLTLGHVNFFPLRQILTFALWLIAGSITIPAAVDTPLIPHSAMPTALPVQVFSHGMASSRTDYTHYLGQLASHGHVVAAIEHRDGSSPGSYINTPEQPQREMLPLRQGDVQVPEGEEMNTERFKFEQLAFREAEIYATAAALKALHETGKLKTTRTSVSSFNTFQNRLDFSKFTIAGHSYGATGALQTLKPANTSTGRTLPLTPMGGVILDPGKSSGRLSADINVPILVLHSNSWSKSHSIFYGRPHFDTVKDLVKGVMQKTSRAASWFLTSLGTSHPSVTDAPLLEPLMLSWTTGASLDVREALDQYVNVTLEFLGWLEEGKKAEEVNGILGEAVTHEEYGKWVSEQRSKELPKDMAKYWEVHVSPIEDKTA